MMIRAKNSFNIKRERTKIILEKNNRRWIPLEDTTLFEENFNRNLATDNNMEEIS